MFEKIFGIFRKGKKSDFSAEIPGETDEGDLFDIGDTGMDDDFDADTISLETGMSDGSFSDAPGGMASEPEFGDSFGGMDSPIDDGLDTGIGLEDSGADEFGALEEPITPPPEVEPIDDEPYAVPDIKKSSKKGLLVTIVLVIAGLVLGFFAATPDSIETIKRATSSEPTVLEQVETLTAKNAELDASLKSYRNVGTVDEILAIKTELKERENITRDMVAIEGKIANRPVVEERLEMVNSELNQTKRALLVQQGNLSNVQKSLKQIEARNNYLITSTRMRLEQLAIAMEKSERLKARLDDKRVKDAETAAMMARDAQNAVSEAAFEALSSL
jgi:hypothetical protein